MHNGSATAMSCTQAMCHLGVVLFLNRVVCKCGVWSYTSCWVSEMICVFVCTHAGVVRAYDEAWQLDKANCHKYFH